MKYAYASKTGHVEKIVGKLGIDALKIVDGTEKIDGDYVIFTYTCGKGKAPKPVLTFLENNPGVKAVVGSGSTAKSHIETFNFGAENISRDHNVPILAKLDGVGTDEDIEAIKTALSKLS